MTTAEMEAKILALEEVVKEFYKYMPYIYVQVVSDAAYEFHVYIPSTRQKPSGLLYYIPVKYSLDPVAPAYNKLYIHYGEQAAVVYELYYEAADGISKPITANAMIPNKLCIIRLQTLIGRAILVNASLEDTAKIHELYVSNKGYFANNPKVYTDPQNIVGSSEDVVTQSEAIAIAEQYADAVFSGKFLKGTTDPITALTGKEDGTFYVQVPADV